MTFKADKDRDEERKRLDRYKEAGFNIALAICDPGAVVGNRRGPSWSLDQDAYSEDQESVTEWQTRAVLELATKITNSTVTQVADQMDEAHATKMAQEAAKTAAWRQDFIQLNQHAERESKRADTLRATLLAVLSTFTESGHPGQPARRSGWIKMDHLEEWHAVLAEHGAESPVAHQTVQEATSALEPAESRSYLGRQEVLDEVRHLTSVVEALREEWRASMPTAPGSDRAKYARTSSTDIAQLPASAIRFTHGDCTACGATDSKCRQIMASSLADRSCCARCKSTDTHPPLRRTS